MQEQVLPFYLLCDESGSMTGLVEQRNNELLPDLHHSISTDPVVADKTRFSIVGFADDARCILPLSDLSDLESIPGLVARGVTDFGAAFRELRTRIDDDVTSLKSQGHLVYRPAVFFLGDGQPTDPDWRDGLEFVTDEGWSYRPNMIAFGLGDADASVIGEVGTFKAFIVSPNVNPARALTEFASALTKSIVKSGQSSTEEGMTLQVPDSIPGFTAVTADVL
jgi:uncharacterized protein YegL